MSSCSPASGLAPRILRMTGRVCNEAASKQADIMDGDQTLSAKRIIAPVADDTVLRDVRVGDRILVSGIVYAGRDAVLPKVCREFALGAAGLPKVDFHGAALMHTAVSCAGIGPTSSNKAEIEESFGPLLAMGIKVFLGKGALSKATVDALGRFGAIFAVVPPVTALLQDALKESHCLAFPELGMEAFYELHLERCPAVVAAAGGESMFEGL